MPENKPKPVGKITPITLNNEQQVSDVKPIGKITPINNTLEVLSKGYNDSSNTAEQYISQKKEIDNLTFFEGVNEDEKDLLKSIVLSGQYSPEEVNDAKLTVAGNHPKQEGFQTWYMNPKTGLPVPLKPGQKAPEGLRVESVWGSQAEDESIGATIGKNLANTVPKFIEGFLDVGATAQTLATGEEPDWYKSTKSIMETYNAPTSAKSQEQVFDSENIDSFADLLDGDRYHLTPENAAGTISQGVSSVIQFLGMNVLTGGASTAVKGATFGAKAALKGRQLAAAIPVNLGEVLEMADEAGLKDREKFAFGLMVATPVSLVETMMGLGPAAIERLGLKDAPKNIAQKVIGKVARDEQGNITKESIKEAYKEVMAGAAGYAQQLTKAGIKGGLEEGTEEGLEGLVRNSGAQIYDKLFAEGKEVGKGKFGIDATSAQSFGEYLSNAIAGALTGVPTSAAMHRKQNSDAFDAIERDGGVTKKAELKSALTNKNITQEEHDLAVQKLDSFKTYNEQLKGSNSKLGGKDKKRLFELAFSAENLNAQKEMVSKDPLSTVESSLLFIKLKQINEELKNVGNEISDITKKEFLQQQATVSEKGKEAFEPKPTKSGVKTELETERQQAGPGEAPLPKSDIKVPASMMPKSMGTKGVLLKQIKTAETEKDIDAFIKEADETFEQTPLELMEVAALRREELNKKDKITMLEKERDNKVEEVINDENEIDGTLRIKEIEDDYNERIDRIRNPKKYSTIIGKNTKEDILSNNASDENIDTSLNKKAVLQLSDDTWVHGTLVKEDDGAIILQTNGDKDYIVGQYEGIKNDLLSTHKLKVSDSMDEDVSSFILDKTGVSFTINGKNYTNQYSDKLSAINRDSDGNVVSVDLTDNKGKKKVFRGKNADSIAYNILMHNSNDSIDQNDLDTLEELIVEQEQKNKEDGKSTAKERREKRRANTKAKKSAREPAVKYTNEITGNQKQQKVKDVKKSTEPVSKSAQIKEKETESIKDETEVKTDGKETEQEIERPIKEAFDKIVKKLKTVSSKETTGRLVNKGKEYNYQLAIELKVGKQIIEAPIASSSSKVGKYGKAHDLVGKRVTLKLIPKEEWNADDSKKDAYGNVYGDRIDVLDSNKKVIGTLQVTDHKVEEKLLGEKKKEKAEEEAIKKAPIENVPTNKLKEISSNLKKKAKAKIEQEKKGGKSLGMNKLFTEGEVELFIAELLGLIADGAIAVEEAIKRLRDKFKDSELTNAKKLEYETDLVKATDKYWTEREKIESDTKITEEQRQAKLDQLDADYTSKVNQSFDSERSDEMKSRVREIYSGIPGFKNDEEIEKYLVKLSKKPEFEKDFKKSIEELYDDGVKEKDEKKMNLALHLNKQSQKKLIQLFNVFRSTTYFPFIRIKNVGGNSDYELSNTEAQLELANYVKNRLSKISEREYDYLRNKVDSDISHNYTEEGKKILFDYLYKVTGLSSVYWDRFMKHHQFKGDKQTAYRTLRNISIIGAPKFNVQVPKTKAQFIENMTVDKKGKGSPLNTIVINTPLTDLLGKAYSTSFKNVKWNRKSTGDLLTHLTNMFSRITSDEYGPENNVYGKNDWVQWTRSRGTAQLVYFDGNYISKDKSADAESMTESDIRFSLINNYQSNKLGSDVYLQNIGQFGDKGKLAFVPAKRYKTIEEAETKYTNLLIEKGYSAKEVKQKVENIKNQGLEEVQKLIKGGDIDSAQLFNLNYAINFREISDFVNGTQEQYIKKGLQAIVDLFKRGGSSNSPGISLNKYVEGGVGESHKLIVINKPIMPIGTKQDFSLADGQEFISRKYSDKVDVSSGGMFNTVLKAITSFATPTGKRFLVKTNAIVIDELVELFPNNQAYKAIKELMDKQGIDRVVTLDGAKYVGDGKVHKLFKENSFEVSDTKFDESFINEIKTDDYLIQQDLVNDGKLKEGSTPIQRIKNMLKAPNSLKTTEMYNKLGDKKILDLYKALSELNPTDFRKYILEKLKYTKEEIDEIADAMAEEEEDLDAVEKDQIVRLIKDGVSFQHPQLNKWLKTFIANIITKEALGRITNKGIFVEMGMFPSEDFVLRDMRVVDGKVLLPEVAISELSGLRAPKGYPTKAAAIEAARGFMDMIGPDGFVRNHEIEQVGKEWVVPGELVMVTRIPADDMHSHTLARVKYTLPASMKNVIITNPESQYISGSDFDGDQRHVEALFKNKNGWQINAETRTGDANKAFMLDTEWYYDPANFKNATNPINTDFANDVIKELPKPPVTENDSVETFIRSRINNNVGLGVVGIMANLQAVYDYLKKHNSKLKDTANIVFPNIKLKNEKSTIDGGIEFGEFKHGDDIKADIGNLLNLALDNVKDPKIERLGLNEVTANSYVMALMLGAKLENVAGFFNHPTVRDYIKRVRDTKSTTSRDSEFDVIGKMILEYNPNADSKHPLKSLPVDVQLTQKDLDTEKSLNVLSFLYKLNNVSKELNILHNVIKSNESAKKTWADLRHGRNNYLSVQNNALKYIDTAEFKDSKFISLAKSSLNMTTLFMKSDAVEDTTLGKSIVDKIEKDFYRANKPHLSKTQLNDVSKAVNQVVLNNSRQVEGDFRVWGQEFTKTIEAMIEFGKRPEILNMLEVVSDSVYDKVWSEEEGKFIWKEVSGIKKVALKQDYKQNIPEDVQKAFQTELKRLEKSTEPKDIKFLKTLVDYATFQYGLASSTYGGSYASLFTKETNIAIGKAVEEEIQKWNDKKYAEEVFDKIYNTVVENNPSLNKTLRREERMNKPGRVVYEALVENFKDIISTDALVDKINDGKDMFTIKKTDKGRNSATAKELRKGNKIRIVGQTKSVEAEVTNVIYDSKTGLYDIYIKPKQKQFSDKEIEEALQQQKDEYYQERFNTNSIGTKSEQIIANAGGFKTNSISFKRFGDWNGIKGNNKMVLSYFNNKTGIDIDVKANELGLNPNDLVDFMLKFPGGVGTKNSTSTDTFYGYYNPKNRFQQQKQSIAPSQKDLLKVIDKVQKAFPKVKVVYDTTLKAAGQLSEDGKTISINPGYAGIDTPIHEFGHVLIDAMGGLNNQIIKKGIEQLKDSELWKETAKAYSNLSEDMLAKEVLAEAIGREGKNLFESKEKQNAFMSWLSGLFFKLKRLLGIEKNVAKDLAAELLSGKDLGKEIVAQGQVQKQKVNTRQIKKNITDASKAVSFDEEEHVYKVGDEELVSVTTVMGNMPMYSFEGVDDGEYDVNSKIGSSIHKVLEDIINGVDKKAIKKKQEFTKNDEVFENIYNQLLSKVEEVSSRGDLLSEVRIAATQHGVAGTSDIVRVKYNGKLDIFDLKTSVNSTKTKEYTTRYGKKRSKEEKHAVQLASYGKMLEQGDPTTGLAEQQIDTLNIIPLKLTIENGKVVEAKMEPMITHAYSSYKDLAEAYVIDERDTKDPSTLTDEEKRERLVNEILKTAISEWKDYAQRISKLRGEEYDATAISARIHKLEEFILLADTVEKSKEYEEEIKMYKSKDKEFQKEFKEYKNDLNKIVKEYVKTDMKQMDLKSLISYYNDIKKMNALATEFVINDIYRNIADRLGRKGIEFIKGKITDYNEGMTTNEDITPVQVFMKALSDFTEKHPDMQELSRVYRKHYTEMVEERGLFIKRVQDVLKEIISDYNKTNGIKETVSNFLNPLQDNSKYYDFVTDSKGRVVLPGSAAFESLTPAQQKFLELYKEAKKNYSDQISTDIFGDSGLIKVERTFAEQYNKNKDKVGLLDAFISYYSESGKSEDGAILEYVDPKTSQKDFLTFAQIKEKILKNTQKGLLSKANSIYQISKYKSRAKQVVIAGKHELVENNARVPYDVSTRGAYEIDEKGRIKSKFNIPFGKDRDYSKDHGKALMNFVEDAVFIKNMSEVVPVVEALEQMAVTTDKKNLKKWLEIWKKGNILKEVMPSLGGKYDGIMKVFRAWTHLRIMAFNIPAAAFNVLVGEYNNFRMFQSDEYAKGKKRFFKDYQKVQTMNKVFQIVSMVESENPAPHISKVLDGLAFGLTRVGENLVQLSAVIGQMTEEEWNMIDKDGNINDKDKAILADRIGAYKKKVADAQGKYSENEKRNFSHFELGRTIMQFKVWMPDTINELFVKEYIDINGEKRQGSFRSLFSRATLELLKNLRDPNERKKIFENKEAYYVNLRKNIRAAMFMTPFFIAYLASSDDDDDKEVAGILSKALNDMSFVFNFESAEFLIATPAASLSTAHDFIKTLHSAAALDEYKNDGEGYEKGDYKFPKQAQGLVPYRKFWKYAEEIVED